MCTNDLQFCCDFVPGITMRERADALTNSKAFKYAAAAWCSDMNQLYAKQRAAVAAMPFTDAQRIPNHAHSNPQVPL